MDSKKRRSLLQSYSNQFSNISDSMMLDASPFDINATVAASRTAISEYPTEALAQYLLNATSTNPENIVAFLAATFGTFQYPGVKLAYVLASANKLPGGAVLTDILSRAIIQASAAGPAKNLAYTLSSIVNKVGEYTPLRLYLDALSAAIQSDGCNAVALVLADVNDRAIDRGVANEFASAMNNNSDINDCLQVGIERLNQTRGILQNMIVNPAYAVDQIIKAATDKYPGVISDTIVQATERKNTNDTNAIRKAMLNAIGNPEVPIDQLTSAFSMASETGNPEVQESLTQILSQPDVEPQVASIIAHAFGPQGTAQTTQSFINIIKHSVSGDTCGLQAAVEASLNLAQNPKDINNIVMNNPDIQSCIQIGIAALLQSPVLNHLGFIGSKSYYYSVENLSWMESFQRCQSLGGSLLQLNSKVTESTINILLQTNLLFQYTKSFQTKPIQIPSTNSSTNGTFFWIGLQNIKDDNGTVKQEWYNSQKPEYYNWCSEKTHKLTGQLSCIAALFEFKKGFPSGCWEFVQCKDSNFFICQFDVDMKQQIGALPQIQIPPSVPNQQVPLPKSPHQQNQTQPQSQPQPQPHIVQVVTNTILNNNDLNTVSEFQNKDQPSIIINIHEFQTPPQEIEVPINGSKYKFKSGGDFNPDSDYQFSVLVSLQSAEPQLAYNQFQTFMPQIQCDGSSIKFVESNQTIEVPFVLSSNIYECEVENCSTVLEKLALAFANTEFIYCFIVLFMIIILLACCQKRGSNYDDSGSMVENFCGVFSDCVEVANS